MREIYSVFREGLCLYGGEDKGLLHLVWRGRFKDVITRETECKNVKLANGQLFITAKACKDFFFKLQKCAERAKCCTARTGTK